MHGQHCISCPRHTCASYVLLVFFDNFVLSDGMKVMLNSGRPLLVLPVWEGGSFDP